MSSFTIHPVEEVDIPRIAELVVGSLTKVGMPYYMSTMWPGIGTAEGQKDMVERFTALRGYLPDPSHFSKVTDQTTGTIVACSLCFYNPTPPTAISGLSGDYWKTEEDREFAAHLKAERDALILRTFARLQGPVTEIMGFFVDPERHQQGIGKLLMRHLIELDSQRGAPIVLIAYPSAKGFYLKQGYEVEEDAVLKVPERWQDRPEAHLISMIHRG